MLDDPLLHEDDKPRLHFSLHEVGHLAASVAVLSVAFSFALTQERILYGDGLDWGALMGILPASTLIVLTAFVLHELAHKFAAQRKRMWAEFRASPPGLAVALLVSAATGIVFAAPGAVYIFGQATDRDSGIISVVGPLVNLAIGFAAVPFAFGAGEPVSAGAVGNIFEVVVFINAFLAAFNMIPVRPLDGSKVWRWSKLAYIAVVALIVVLMLLYLGAPLLGSGPRSYALLF